MSSERQRKRRRPASPPSPCPSLPALQARLQAHLAAGAALPEAIVAVLPPATAGLDLSTPILATLAGSPALRDDPLAVARMCHAVVTHFDTDAPLSLVQPSPTPSPPPARARLNLRLAALADVAGLIAAANRIVVLTGAGVSVSCGIPDFRSKGGLYESVMARFGLPDPQAIFDLDEFKLDPALFYSFASHVMPSATLRPSPTHRFVAELDQRGKLLRNYSQNIDGLERRAGVSDPRLILCHGSFLSATCMRPTCRAQIPGHRIAPEVADGIIPLCRKCAVKPRPEESDDDDSEMPAEAMGVLKPDIVFFGENLPRAVEENLQADVDDADLLLVLGTSLQVAPVARIPEYFRDPVPRILVNRELVSYDFDVELLGDCDVVIRELRNALNWRDEVDIQRLPPSDTPEQKSEALLSGEQNNVAGDQNSVPVSDSFVRNDNRSPAISNENNESSTPNGQTGSSVQNGRIDGEGPHAGTVTFRPPRRFIFPGASDSIRESAKEAIAGPAECADTRDQCETAELAGAPEDGQKTSAAGTA